MDNSRPIIRRRPAIQTNDRSEILTDGDTAIITEQRNRQLDQAISLSDPHERHLIIAKLAAENNDDYQTDCILF